MQRKRWEVHLQRALYKGLFQPRLRRIVALLNEKSPKRIGSKDKRAINKSIKPLIHKAVSSRCRIELKGLKTKSFKLKLYRPGQRKDKIVQKIKKYEEARGKRIHRLIYTLWNDQNECIYVGQTKRGLPEIVGKRGRLYKESARLKLFFTDKNKLDRYEGIAYHVLAPRLKSKPKFNRIQTKNARYHCPFCQKERRIRKEISRALVLVMPGRG
jgi:hypothetical protein